MESANRERLLKIIAAEQAQIDELVARVAQLEKENVRLRQGGEAKGS